MVKLNNFWIDSVTRKDLTKFINEHYGKSEYSSHIIQTDIITKKNYIIVYFETPYGDDAHEVFDAYGYHGRSDIDNTTVEGWRQMISQANAGRIYSGKSYEQNLNELLDLQSQQHLTF